MLGTMRFMIIQNPRPVTGQINPGSSAANYRSVLQEPLWVDRGPKLLRTEERAQFYRRFTRIVLRKKVAALYRVSRQVASPITPDAERSARVCVPVIERSILAPQCKRRAHDAAVHLSVVHVLRKVEGRCGAIFFANCMDGRRVAKGNSTSGGKLLRFEPHAVSALSTTASALAVIIRSGKGSGCASSDHGQ